MAVDRRSFLKGATAAAAGVALTGPFDGFLARAASAAGPLVTPPTNAGVADLRDGVVRLKLPAGFQYRSFNPTGEAMAYGGALPGNHDGMATFKARNDRVL